MTELRLGQVWHTKPELSEKIVGYEVTGISGEFVAVQALGHETTRHLTKDLFYAMFDSTEGEEN